VLSVCSARIGSGANGGALAEPPEWLSHANGGEGGKWLKMVEPSKEKEVSSWEL